MATSAASTTARSSRNRTGLDSVHTACPNRQAKPAPICHGDCPLVGGTKPLQLVGSAQLLVTALVIAGSRPDRPARHGIPLGRSSTPDANVPPVSAKIVVSPCLMTNSA